MNENNRNVVTTDIEATRSEESNADYQETGDLVVGLDIGTTKICCVVGEMFDDRIEIIGVGTVPSLGLKKGVVVNIESTVNSIRQAVKLAEESAGCDLAFGVCLCRDCR